MSWIRLDERLLLDDWYAGLSDPCRLAWIHLLLLAGRNRGRFPKCSSGLLCQQLLCTENATSELVKSALTAGKISVTDDGQYEVKNFRKYLPDPTHAERQARYRSDDSDSHSPSRDSHAPSLPSRDATIHNDTIRDEREKKESGKKEKPDIPDQIIRIMHELADRAGVPAYRDQVTPERWRPDLLKRGEKIGFAVMLEEAERFQQWFLSQVEIGKIKRNATHEPRRRFLVNWLGGVGCEKQRAGDDAWGNFPEEPTGPSPLQLAEEKMAREDAARAIDPGAVKAGERLLENLSGIPRGARVGGPIKITGEKA